MKNRLASLAHRRLELLGHIEAQRLEMAETFVLLHKPLVVADVGFHAVRTIYNHPALFAGGVTALLTWRRHGIVGLARNGWRLLYLYPSAIFFGLKYISSVFHSPDENSPTKIL